jgi:8-hydroxy-5-deazaflavin:NADPH oxidoreductase
MEEPDEHHSPNPDPAGTYWEASNVVKAANTLGAAVLASDPDEAGGRRVIILSGDDVNAKSEVIALFEDAGFVTIDLGGLVAGGVMQQLGGPLAGVNLIWL